MKVNWIIDFSRLKAFSGLIRMCWVEFRWNFYDWTWNTVAWLIWKSTYIIGKFDFLIFARQTQWRQKFRICPDGPKFQPGASVLAAPFTLNWYQIGKQLPTWKGMRAKRAEKKSQCWPKLLVRSMCVLWLVFDHFKKWFQIRDFNIIFSSGTLL